MLFIGQQLKTLVLEMKIILVGVSVSVEIIQMTQRVKRKVIPKNMKIISVVYGMF